jgi:cyclophilin family peptidyl-prolyl cis-trans isomerase
MLTNRQLPGIVMFIFFAAVITLAAGCNDDSHGTMETLDKWPADYPADGDSMATIFVSIDGQSIGAMSLSFSPDSAPNHVRNFKWLANSRFYDGVRFHRVIREFMVQGGDPTGTGSGGAPWTVDAEFNGIHHVRGIVSMARSSDPNSASSQFFVVQGDSFPYLDEQYTVFGRLGGGFETLDSIANVATGGPEHSSPLLPVVMDSVRISPMIH